MALTQVDQGMLGTNAQYTGFKNRLINSAMVIDQRNAGASVTPTNGSYTLDRWTCGVTQASKFTVQQNAASVTPPAGFKNYLGITSSSAYSIGAGDIFYVKQPIEGFNVSDLGFGAAGASTVTLSFWVRSSLTGSFGGALQNSAENRSYPFSYTISTANTWEYETVTIAGDTSGTWLTTNGIGLSVVFGLGNGATYSGTANAWAGAQYFAPTGSVSVVGTSGATFYITGVQLEKGSTATSFDYRPYTTELQLCQRYYSQAVRGAYPGSFALQAYSAAGATCSLQFPVTMRATPTLFVYYNGTVNAVGNVNTAGSVSITPAQTWWTANGFLGQQPTGSPFTIGMAYGFDYTATAEL
jgi:hypothetical protein